MRKRLVRFEFEYDGNTVGIFQATSWSDIPDDMRPVYKEACLGFDVPDVDFEVYDIKSYFTRVGLRRRKNAIRILLKHCNQTYKLCIRRIWYDEILSPLKLEDEDQVCVGTEKYI